MAPVLSLHDAQALLPEARQRLGEVAGLVHELEEEVGRLRAGELPPEASACAAALEGRIDAALAWFDRHGVLIKGLRPGLLDFPARALRDGEPVDVLLCWREDEAAIAFYHLPDTGDAGRMPVAMLDDV